MRGNMLPFRQLCALGILAATFLAAQACVARAQEVVTVSGKPEPSTEGRVYTAEDLDKLPVSALLLKSGWQIQSSCVAKATGEQISAAGFDASTWHKSDLPATVVGALVTDKTYPDPYFGTNLKSLPGMNYSNKSFFAIQDMPAGSPFLCSWWFRAEFLAPADLAQKNAWLHFLGINYRANVWINGVKVGDAKDVAGTYRAFEFNVSKNLHI